MGSGDVSEMAERKAKLEAVLDKPFGPNLAAVQELPSYESLGGLEEKLRKGQRINFDVIFAELTGYYLTKRFLLADFSVDKAVFLKDVELYRKMRSASARLKVARLIHARFVGEDKGDHNPGESVFDTRKRRLSNRRKNHKASTDTLDPLGFRSERTHTFEDEEILSSLRIGVTNSIGIYGPSVEEVATKIAAEDAPRTLFDDIAQEVLNDLRMDVFPRFERSLYFAKYIQTKSFEDIAVAHSDFISLRMLGRGAFGLVNACLKTNTGKLYASKSINKRRVLATDSVSTIMSERNILACMDSPFVTGLKYAVQDKNSLYLVMDLMLGGDLKSHLNRAELFSETRSRFYAAQILLGLEHIHSKGVIYRDVKLENVLLDDKGNCKVSDLGLAVMTDRKMKGYAGTPGYTAPEVIMMQSYDKMCDFFSFGVLVYRFLTGRKPFGSHTGSSDLDKNVVKATPEYPSKYFDETTVDFLSKLMEKDPTKRLGVNGIHEIKNHPWFDPIDWGLLEAGYIDPPFVPNVDIEALKQIGGARSNQDDKYRRIKLTDEFQKSLSRFDFVSVSALQKELVEAMELDDTAASNHSYSRKKGDESSKGAAARKAHTKCCALM